jgi:hypothetical protein
MGLQKRAQQMKRYAIFYHGNQPLGGMEDFIASFSTVDEAANYLKSNKDLAMSDDPFKHAVIEDMHKYLGEG